MAEDELRKRIELGIRVAAPFLDLLLAVGDRLSRIGGRPEPDPLPPHIRLDGGRARQGLAPRPASADRTGD
jgi:hypothetical protein